MKAIIKTGIFLLSMLFMGACSKDDSVVLLPYSGLMNGGFEYGNLSGWVSSGDVRVVPALDTISPFDGGYMALLSTGMEPGHDHGRITQTFKVKEEHVFLHFRWNLLSEEFISHIYQQPQHYFRVTLIRGNGSEQMLLHNNTSIAAFQAGALPTPPGNMKPLPPAIFSNGYMTGWRELVFHIGQYKGEEVTLKFEAIGHSGTGFRIGVLVDGVSVLGELQ